MIKYQRNNIAFRIASADAIGKFKSTQAHSFVQLARKELNFDEAAKETVLLEYDRLSQWIFRVERICLSAGEGNVSNQLKAAIVESLDDEFVVIETVMESNVQVFSKLSISFTKMIHDYSSALLKNYMSAILDQDIARAYSAIVSTISGYLQHLLVCMHEFNSNVIKRRNPPFVCSSDFSVDSGVGNERFLPCTTRAFFFQHLGLGNTFILKNYSQHDIYNDAKNYFADLGFDIVPEDEITTQPAVLSY